jgi:hypothetical protein
VWVGCGREVGWVGGVCVRMCYFVKVAEFVVGKHLTAHMGVRWSIRWPHPSCVHVCCVVAKVVEASGLPPVGGLLTALDHSSLYVRPARPCLLPTQMSHRLASCPAILRHITGG